MSQNIALPKRRIGRGTGVAMVMVALVFDFAVVIMLIGGIIFALSTLGDSSIGKHVVQSTATHCAEAEKAKANGEAFGSKKEGWGRSYHEGECAVGKGIVAATVAIVGIGSFFTFPLMAAMVSAIAGIISVLLFTLWFAVLRVNVMGLSYRRVMVNLTTAIIESIPVLNLLPMQTICVLLHIRLANKEDDHKIKAVKAKLQAQETINAFMQGRAARAPNRTSVSQQLESEGVLAA
ncbi:MAG: hypothetical protein KBD21_03340 [Candidatus Pacebacteria bacterium]|nr:hypothetical protein [Candidatus Paceibacterota bacterium]